MPPRLKRMPNLKETVSCHSRNDLPPTTDNSWSCKSRKDNEVSHSMKNLAFHSWLGYSHCWLTISLTYRHFSLKGWENALFELGSERVTQFRQSKCLPGWTNIWLPQGCNECEPFHSWEWSMSKFPSSPTRNITSHSKESLAFHSLLRWKMIVIQILATSLIHFLSNRLGESTFWAQEWKG